MASMSSSCLAAAAAASSGDWLAVLEQHLAAGSGADSGLLPAVTPPGMSHGMFGAWNMPEDLRPTGECTQACRQCLDTHAATKFYIVPLLLNTNVLERTRRQGGRRASSLVIQKYSQCCTSAPGTACQSFYVNINNWLICTPKHWESVQEYKNRMNTLNLIDFLCCANLQHMLLLVRYVVQRRSCWQLFLPLLPPSLWIIISSSSLAHPAPWVSL